MEDIQDFIEKHFICEEEPNLSGNTQGLLELKIRVLQKLYFEHKIGNEHFKINRKGEIKIKDRK